MPETAGPSSDIVQILRTLLPVFTLIVGMIGGFGVAWLQASFEAGRRRREVLRTIRSQPLNDISEAVKQAEIILARMHVIRSNLALAAEFGSSASVSDVELSEDMVWNFTLAITRAGTTVDAVGDSENTGAALRDLPIMLSSFQSIFMPSLGGLDPATLHSDSREPVMQYGHRIVDLKGQHQSLLESYVS